MKDLVLESLLDLRREAMGPQVKVFPDARDTAFSVNLTAKLRARGVVALPENLDRARLQTLITELGTPDPYYQEVAGYLQTLLTLTTPTPDGPATV